MTSADAAEAVIGYLQAVGIRAKLRPLERAAFNKSIADKKLRNLVQVIGGAFGNAATRLEAYRGLGRRLRLRRLSRTSTGSSASRRPSSTGPSARRRCTGSSSSSTSKAMFAPIWELAFVNGVGPRVEESGLGLIAGYAFSAPYEDVKLKAK